jgi:hypothetical protein
MHNILFIIYLDCAIEVLCSPCVLAGRNGQNKSADSFALVHEKFSKMLVRLCDFSHILLVKIITDPFGHLHNQINFMEGVTS